MKNKTFVKKIKLLGKFKEKIYLDEEEVWALSMG